jgi:cytoskeletal protein CcmA (bactofilin family)
VIALAASSSRAPVEEPIFRPKEEGSPVFHRRRSSDGTPIDPTDPKTTVLARDLVLEGRLRTPGDAILYGTLMGDLEVGGRLHMLGGSRVQGTVLASEARLEGTVEGPVTVSGKLEVSASARLEGDLQAGTLAMAEGAVLLGTLKIAGETHRFVERRSAAVPESVDA